MHWQIFAPCHDWNKRPYCSSATLNIHFYQYLLELNDGKLHDTGISTKNIRNILLHGVVKFDSADSAAFPLGKVKTLTIKTQGKRTLMAFCKSDRK